MDLLTQVLSAVLVLGTLAVAVSAGRRGRRVAARVESRPDGRVWFYRRFVLRMWPMAVLVPAIAWSSRDLTAADLGWARPHGILGYALTGYLALGLTVGALRERRRMRRGLAFPARRGIAFMVPRTPRERWWALALSVTAGVTEEAIYRGALTGVGTHVYHLPFAAAAAGALLLFTAAHLYQGWRGVTGAAAVGIVYAIIYALSGSLLLPILGHTIQDVVGLLLVPAEPTPRRPEPGLGGEGRQESGDGPAAQTQNPGSPSEKETAPRPAAPAGAPTLRASTPD